LAKLAEAKCVLLDRIPKMIDEVEKVILGKRPVIQLTVAALLADMCCSRIYRVLEKQ